AIDDTGIQTVVVGGGVAANAYLRRELEKQQGLSVYFPPLSLCGDNAAMVAGIAWHYVARGDVDGWDIAPSSRDMDFKRPQE
ncbi:MAG: tRNA (adenosine(37)-N6)-threonylcarbamoyltransferase complex transferase subunit TsaD, partial [Rectinema sp.]